MESIQSHSSSSYLTKDAASAYCRNLNYGETIAPVYDKQCASKKHFSAKRLFCFLRFILYMLTALVYANSAAYAQKSCSAFKSAYPACGTMNRSFKTGEVLNYKLFYHWHFVWMQTGSASVSTTLRNFYGIPCYYISATGRSAPKYDWFYKIRDTLASYMDTLDLTPIRFYRSTHEASVHVRNDNVFNNNKHIAYYLNEGREFHRDSVTIPSGTMDILTSVYFTRCINFGCIGTKDSVLLHIYLDGKVYDVCLRFLGKEVINSGFGKFRCEKLSVNLIPGTIFREGAKMTVWATDDANHIPLQVEAPIIIGSVRAELESFSDLRNAMDAKVK